MVDALPVVALAQLLADQPAHHDLHPLLADDGVLGLLEALVVFVVDAVKGRRDLRLLGQEGLGLGSRHGDLVRVWLARSRNTESKGCGRGVGFNIQHNSGCDGGR